MLKQRLLTAALLIPLMVAAILFLPNSVFAIVLGAIAIIGLWEWAGLMGIEQFWDRCVYVMLVLPLMWISGFLPEGFLIVTYVGAAGWLVGLVMLVWFNARPSPIPSNLVVGGISGAFVVVPAWMALVILHGGQGYGPYYVLFLMVLVSLADTAAYFVGRYMGTHKLAVNISPGKTWEGVWGALSMALLLSLTGGHFLGISAEKLPMFVSLCVITVAFSVVGDLFESMFKRRAGVKDSSNLLPGHGGIMDRIDSLTAAAPIFVIGLLLMGSVG